VGRHRGPRGGRHVEPGSSPRVFDPRRGGARTAGPSQPRGPAFSFDRLRPSASVHPGQHGDDRSAGKQLTSVDLRTRTTPTASIRAGPDSHRRGHQAQAPTGPGDSLRVAHTDAAFRKEAARQGGRLGRGGPGEQGPGPVTAGQDSDDGARPGGGCGFFRAGACGANSWLGRRGGPVWTLERQLRASFGPPGQEEGGVWSAGEMRRWWISVRCPAIPKASGSLAGTADRAGRVPCGPGCGAFITSAEHTGPPITGGSAHCAGVGPIGTVDFSA